MSLTGDGWGGERTLAMLASIAVAVMAAFAAKTANAQTCGQFVDVITAPSGKIGNHACDSDRDGTVKDSEYCWCNDCAIQPERCHRKGDLAFCSCDPSRQHCDPRPCISSGACDPNAPSSYTWAIDCNDYNRSRFPGNCETCGDTVDDDCDGSTTDCSTGADADGDGVPTPTDCLDNNPQAYPGAPEIQCNGVDEDCSGADLCDGTQLDPDGDGFSAPADCNEGDASVYPGAPDICGDQKNSDCDPLGLDCATDQDADGVEAGQDCDDQNPDVHPGAFDLCGNRIDEDCDGFDRACVMDQDRDGHDASTAGGDDCNDLDSRVHPGASEVCGDGIDQDCQNGDVRCEVADADGDGHQSVEYGGDDCDDTDDSVYPGAPEHCGDGIDSNCDRNPDLACPGEVDADGDGFQSSLLGGADCNDRDSRINPFSAEICGDGVDNDCDGVAEELCFASYEPTESPLDLVNHASSSCGCSSLASGPGSSFSVWAAFFGLLALGRRRS